MEVTAKTTEEPKSESNAFENEILEQCYKLVDTGYLTPRDNWLRNTVAECVNFVELRQWLSEDTQRLALAGVPTLPIDRITRSIDTLMGIRENTGGKKKITKRELGDERVANLLNKTCDYVDGHGFKEVKDEAFKSLLYHGIGIRKVGFDPYALQGAGEIWAEKVEVEDFYWGRCKRKDMEDVPWVAECQLMNWEDAVSIVPDKAQIIEGLKKRQQTNWDKIKGSSVEGASMAGRDYQQYLLKPSEPPYMYPDQVKVWNTWIKKTVPYRKVVGLQQSIAPDGNIMVSQVVRAENMQYQPVEGEKLVGNGVEVFWVHYIWAGEKGDGVLLATEMADDHPYIITCADRKKNGMPFGFVEKIVPHQKRINVAWAQKVAYNNRSIKSPIVMDEGAVDYQQGIKATSFGTIMEVKNGKRIHELNLPLQTNLQAVEEGQAARADMDNITAVGEPALSGAAGNTTSGVQLSLQQNAAITPVNKWIQAENASEIIFWRKVMKLIIANFTPERYARIIGFSEFLKTISPEFDQMTGQMITPPVQFPLDPQTTEYDVIIEDQAVSDFKQQQSFNAIMALQTASPIGMFDEEFLIKAAPIKNTDEALASHQRHKQDMMLQMFNQMNMMQQQINLLSGQVAKEQKGGPNRSPNQPKNAQQGANAPQHRQSMLGGMNPASPVN